MELETQSLHAAWLRPEACSTHLFINESEWPFSDAASESLSCSVSSGVWDLLSSARIRAHNQSHTKSIVLWNMALLFFHHYRDTCQLHSKQTPMNQKHLYSYSTYHFNTLLSLGTVYRNKNCDHLHKHQYYYIISIYYVAFSMCFGLLFTQTTF